MAVYFLRLLLDVIWLALPPAVLAWALWRWLTSRPRIADPVWRGYTALLAMALTAISVLLWVTSLIWARVIGGFPFYDPILMRFLLGGGLTCLSGLVLSFPAKGKLRWPILSLSVLMTFLWFAVAIAQ